MKDREVGSRVIPKWLRIAIPAALITVWMVIGGLGGPYFGRIEEVSDVDLVAFLPKSAEATKVNDEVKKFRSTATLPAIVVFTPTDSELDTAETAIIDARVKQLSGVEGIEGEPSPAIVSEDKKAAIVVVQTKSEHKIKDVVATIKQALQTPQLKGIDYKIAGPAGFASDLTKAFAGIDGILLLTALAVVFVILVVVYRSILLPIIVLLTSMIALTAAILVVWNLAKLGHVQLNGQVQGILFILVIGAATDYSLLYISRYREELYQVQSTWQATRQALRGAWEPIVASGGTVIVGLMCLLLSDLASNKALGPVGAIGITMAIASALTFLPSMLYLIGRASFWPAHPRADRRSRNAHVAARQRGVWQRVSFTVARHPRPIWVATGCFLLVAAMGALSLRADGVEQSKLVVGYSEAREGQAIISKHFPNGSGSPALILVPADMQSEVLAVLEADKGVDEVVAVATDSPNSTKPLGSTEAAIKQTIREAAQGDYDAKIAQIDAQETALAAQIGEVGASQIAEEIRAQVPSIDQIVDQAYPFKDAKEKVVGGTVLLQATLHDAPDSYAAKATIQRLRSSVRGVNDSALIGGSTAVQLDTNTASIHDRSIILPVILAAITVILMVLLRSILAPLLLLVTTVLSFGASLGVAAWLFNDVWKFPGADPSVVLYAFVFLVALGIDYNIFLMTRVREEALQLGTSQGMLRGLVVTGGVITSAGVVLAATFAALSVIPILFLLQLAFIVAFGVLLDTFVVRSLLVPALIHDIGSAVWWPSKLMHKK